MILSQISDTFTPKAIREDSFTIKRVSRPEYRVKKASIIGFLPNFKQRSYWQSHDSTLAEFIKPNISQFLIYLEIEDISELIRYFIKNQSNLIPLLAIVYKVIHLKDKYFKNKAILFLSINKDPEFIDDFLLFYIRTREYTNAFLTTLYQLRNEYYDDLYKNQIWILVTTDFKPIEIEGIV